MQWMNSAIQMNDDLTIAAMAVRLLLSLFFGFCVASTYWYSRNRQQIDGRPLAATLVLLSVLIALVTLVIGNNIARAFGLVGSLSIVRFRTVVEDTRDTAFVIFAVVVGMAGGAGYGFLAALGIPIVSITAILLNHFAESRAIAGTYHALLTIRLGLGLDPDGLLQPAFAQYAMKASIQAIATARQGAALEITYRVSLKVKQSPIEFIRAVNQIDGLQNLEFRLQDKN